MQGTLWKADLLSGHVFAASGRSLQCSQDPLAVSLLGGKGTCRGVLGWWLIHIF